MTRGALEHRFHWDTLDSTMGMSFLPQEYLNIACSEKQKESSVTSQLTMPDLDRVRLLVERVHCTHGSRTTLTLDYVDGRLVESWHGYDRVIVGQSRYDNSRLMRVSGMIHKTAIDRCPAFGTTIATMLIEDLDTDEQVLVDGFERASRHTYKVPCHQEYDIDSGEYYGDYLDNPRNWFSGSISHSTLGSTVVSTAEHLGLAVDTSPYSGSSIWPVYRKSTGGDLDYAPGGPVVLTGLEGQTATLETAYTRRERTPRGAHMKLSLFENDGSLSGEYRASSVAFECGALSNTTDTDMDGLPDAWERCNGLNLTSADADLDEDGDGLTNREEYEHLSRADRSEGAAVVGEQGLNVSMTSKFDSALGIMHYSVSPDSFALNSAIIPGNNTFVLTIDDESSWDLDRLPNECVVQADSIQSVICTIDYGQQTKLREFYAPQLYFSRGSVTQGTLTATLVADAMDPLLRARNQQASVEKEIQSQLWVNMPTWSAGHSDAVRELIVNVKRRLGVQDPDLTVMASFDVPDGVVIASAEIESDVGNGYTDIISRACSIGDSVICDLDDADYPHRFWITVRYYVMQPGSHDLVWNFYADGHDKQHALMTRTTAVMQFESTAKLQALINEAIVGESVLSEKLVTLPGGTYAGTLYGQLHRLVLRGATEGEPTILVPGNSSRPIATRLLDGSRLEHLEIRNTGAPLVQLGGTPFITISNSRIVPLPGQFHQVSSLMISNYASYRLIGNEFSGWGVGDGNHCESLLSIKPDYSAYIDHNVFIDNHCDQLINIDAAPESKYDRGAAEPLALVVQNNSFLNNPSLIHLKPHGEPYFVHLKNNIVVGAASVFVADPEIDTYQRMAASTIVSSANLLWNSGSTSMLPTEPGAKAHSVTEVADLHVDPLLAVEGQSRLSPWSPAIDAGVEPTPYNTMLSFTRFYQEGLKEDSQVPHEPLDGLGDGDAIHDIGSYEYMLPDR